MIKFPICAISHRWDLCADARVTPPIECGAHPIAHRILIDPALLEYAHQLTMGFFEACGLTQLMDPFPPEKFCTDYNWLSS